MRQEFNRRLVTKEFLTNLNVFNNRNTYYFIILPQSA